MNRRLRSVFLVLLVIAMVGSILAGCTNSKKTAANTLVIGTPYTIDTLNPFMYSSDGDRYVLSQVQEALIDGEAGNYYPLLAESWSNPDSLTWDFVIRQNAYWQDDNPVYAKGTKVQVTAEVVKDVWKWVLDPANGARLQPALAKVISKVEVVGDNTVRFTTKAPSAFLLENVNRVPIFSLEALEKMGRDKFDKYPIGTGPFKFKEYLTDDRVVLVRNDNYHIKPSLEQVIFRIIPDSSVAAIALQTGEIDVALQVPANDAAKVAADDKLVIMPNTVGWYRYMAFNFTNSLFKDKKVREAIGMGLDMDTITRAIFPAESLAKRAYGPIPVGIPGYTEEWASLWKYDPDGAKALLAEAGWKPGADGVLAKNGKKLSFVLKTPNDVNRSKLGVMISTQLKGIGIDCVAQAQEWATHLADITSGNTEAFIMGGGSTPDGLSYMFHSVYAAGGAHNTRYVNKEIDKAIDLGMATVDAVAREEIWRGAAEIAINDRVQIPCYSEFVQIGVSKRVEGFDKPTVWMSLVSPLRNVSKK